MATAALIVAIVAALAAVGSVWYTRRAAASAVAAARSAATTAELDSERRHAELALQFDITCEAAANGADQSGELRISLTGPPDLENLDEVTIVILDETGIDRWGHGLPTGVSEAEARQFVWGPWEFNTGASAQVLDNRTTKPRPYSRASGKNWDRLSLTRTRPGRWMAMDPAQWRQQQRGPIRLQITSRRGSQIWSHLYEIASPS
jgi:hypothetical protein